MNRRYFVKKSSAFTAGASVLFNTPVGFNALEDVRIFLDEIILK